MQELIEQWRGSLGVKLELVGDAQIQDEAKSMYSDTQVQGKKKNSENLFRQ